MSAVNFFKYDLLYFTSNFYLNTNNINYPKQFCLNNEIEKSLITLAGLTIYILF